MVKPKKHLGQHFLTDLHLAQKITQALFDTPPDFLHIVEIGAGTGVLTDFLLYNPFQLPLTVVEIDTESVHFLEKKYQDLRANLTICETDFLAFNLSQYFGNQPLAIIGNFPYNISSPIFFQILEHKQVVKRIVCMLQKEVAERLASPPNSKEYGILSVFLQAFYKIEYLFSVPSEVFNPAPKVQSGVIRLQRNEVEHLACDEAMFRKIVKQGFNNRRKTLRNALKVLQLNERLERTGLLDKRAEQLSVQDFVYLTQIAQENKK
ncbi:MAG: 16S rRNA (adenine(1518)-N(6)/adenine(1519)-N(6))-dimethyltransferase RsmA [Microscillaceae bacterium]|nr:16S rRNA (adenine(1518)-N(6)/adenine(1519)-N(6))-dimethyltransferase RsmA [Microscillaceae bacterium]MDW8459904.1 16S rRNA (adenine(1518)-N(6)/adenine(1519)-N(6))-dimethyltransferase RsmA [Cytophagales bacterium]